MQAPAAELCDTYDSSGRRTGRVVRRGEALPADEHFLVVQMWLRDERGDYLIQRRALHLASGPGMWATTAGYVWAGEDSRTAALREVEEELGIRLAPGMLHRFERLLGAGLLQDIWLADVVRATIGAPRPGEDVAGWRWASISAIDAMVRIGEFFAYSYLARLP